MSQVEHTDALTDQQTSPPDLTRISRPRSQPQTQAQQVIDIPFGCLTGTYKDGMCSLPPAQMTAAVFLHYVPDEGFRSSGISNLVAYGQTRVRAWYDL